MTRFNGAGSGIDDPAAAVASPDGSKTFVTGASETSATSYSFVTVAYNSATGAPVWIKRYNASQDQGDRAHALAMSRDGTRLYVTGNSFGPTDGYITVAYNAATGAKLWVSRYTGVANSGGEPWSIAVSQDGARVYVIGSSYGGTATREDYATVAYDATSGRQLWVRRYNYHGNGKDWGYSVVCPGGNRVIVTGTSRGLAGTGYDYATLAYNATTGALMWAKRYNGPGNVWDEGKLLSASPDGRTIWVSGFSKGADLIYDYATIAYDARTGNQLWAKRYSIPAAGANYAESIAASPDSRTVFVSGEAYFSQTHTADFATVAYRASTGAQLWVKRYTGSELNHAVSVVVSADSTKVYVAGVVYALPADTADYLLLAYSASTGDRLWVRRYNGTGSGDDLPAGMAVTSDDIVVVTGESYGGLSTGFDYATVAYQG